jgi:hypothetical protein
MRLLPIVVNNETSEFVMLHNITRVVARQDGGSNVFIRSDSSAGSSTNRQSYINSLLSCREILHKIPTT